MAICDRLRGCPAIRDCLTEFRFSKNSLCSVRKQAPAHTRRLRSAIRDPPNPDSESRFCARKRLTTLSHARSAPAHAHSPPPLPCPLKEEKPQKQLLPLREHHHPFSWNFSLSEFSMRISLSSVPLGLPLWASLFCFESLVIQLVPSGAPGCGNSRPR